MWQTDRQTDGQNGRSTQCIAAVNDRQLLYRHTLHTTAFFIVNSKTDKRSRSSASRFARANKHNAKPCPVDLGLFLVVGGRWQQQFATERWLLLVVVMRMRMVTVSSDATRQAAEAAVRTRRLTDVRGRRVRRACRLRLSRTAITTCVIISVIIINIVLLTL